MSMASSPIVQLILSLWCFTDDQRGYSGKSEIYFISLDLFYTNVYYLWSQMDKTSVRIDYPVGSCKITVIHFGSMLPNLKADLRGLSSRKAVWLIALNMFTAL